QHTDSAFYPFREPSSSPRLCLGRGWPQCSPGVNWECPYWTHARVVRRDRLDQDDPKLDINGHTVGGFVLGWDAMVYAKFQMPSIEPHRSVGKGLQAGKTGHSVGRRDRRWRVITAQHMSNNSARALFRASVVIVRYGSR